MLGLYLHRTKTARQYHSFSNSDMPPMKFVVKKAWSSGGCGRVGALEIGSCPGPIETPALLLSTRKGLPHFISPDLLTSLPSPDSHLLQISPLHFLEGLASTTISKLGGLHQMLGLHQYGMAAVARDSIQCLPESKGATKLGASFETPCGRLLIKPKDYVEMISCMRPNIWATLADEVPAWVTDKRNKTSVDRTVRWLDDCLALNPVVGSVFGAIVGGTNLDERKRCAEEVAKRNVSGGATSHHRPNPRRLQLSNAELVAPISDVCVPSIILQRDPLIDDATKNSLVTPLSVSGVGFPKDGYWIGGFGLGEGIDERPALLSAIIDLLPDEKPRMISGLGLPEEILEGIDAGIDLFDSTLVANSNFHLLNIPILVNVFCDGIWMVSVMVHRYIYSLTLGGFALTFSLDKGGNQYNFQKSQIGSDLTKINLRAKVYRKDMSPILGNCICYTCQNHTKAYINHLFNVHEMLAQILLEIHNTHHYLTFFHVIRESIKDGRFEKFRQTFIESRRAHHEREAVCA
ncbi:Queuine tRNA-ribosyltransferase accessory subunit 2 [Glycine soja]